MAYLLRFYHHVKVTTMRPAMQLVAPEQGEDVLNGFMRTIFDHASEK